MTASDKIRLGTMRYFPVELLAPLALFFVAMPFVEDSRRGDISKLI